MPGAVPRLMWASRRPQVRRLRGCPRPPALEVRLFFLTFFHPVWFLARFKVTILKFPSLPPRPSQGRMGQVSRTPRLSPSWPGCAVWSRARFGCDGVGQPAVLSASSLVLTLSYIQTFLEGAVCLHASQGRLSVWISFISHLLPFTPYCQ